MRNNTSVRVEFRLKNKMLPDISSNEEKFEIGDRGSSNLAPESSIALDEEAKSIDMKHLSLNLIKNRGSTLKMQQRTASGII